MRENRLFTYHHNNKEYCMKKFVCVLILTCVIMGGVFAQADGARNSVAIDVFRFLDGFLYFGSDYPIGTTISVSYERSIVPHWSLGPNLDIGFWYLRSSLFTSSAFGFSLGAAAEGRYYPLSDFDKLFLGATLGFTLVAGNFYQDTDFGLNTSLKIGYKIQTSKKIYIEPSLSYVYQHDFLASGNDGFFRGGLRLGVSF